MPVSTAQFEALRTQLRKKRETLGDSEYQAFLHRAATAGQPAKPADEDGFGVDVVQGAAKSIGETALGIGTLGRKIQRRVSKGVDTVFGTKGFGLGPDAVFDEGSSQNTKAKEVVARDTTGEKVGGFAADVASFAVPGGAVSKAVKGAGFLTRVAALAGSDAAVTIAKKGSVDKDAVDSAILSAVFPVAGATGSALKRALPSTADAGGKVINSLIKPLLKDFAYGKNPGKAVAEAGITANSLDELGTKIGVKRNEVGKQIGAIVSTHEGTFSLLDEASPIEEAITEAAKNPRTNAGIIRRLQDVQDDLLRVTTDAADQRVIGRQLDNLSAQDVFDLKKEVGDLTRWTGNASDDEIVNKALARTYGKLKGLLDEKIPELKPLNEQYGDLTSAEIATKYRDKIASRQNLISITGAGTGAAAALTTAIVTGGAMAPILVGATAAGLTQAMKSPAAKTRVAAWLASAPATERAEAFKKAPWLKGALQAVLFNVSEESEGRDNDAKDRNHEK